MRFAGYYGVAVGAAVGMMINPFSGISIKNDMLSIGRQDLRPLQPNSPSPRLGSTARV